VARGVKGPAHPPPSAEQTTRTTTGPMRELAEVLSVVPPTGRPVRRLVIPNRLLMSAQLMFGNSGVNARRSGLPLVALRPLAMQGSITAARRANLCIASTYSGGGTFARCTKIPSVYEETLSARPLPLRQSTAHSEPDR
jgi:hypothetical protein